MCIHIKFMLKGQNVLIKAAIIAKNQELDYVAVIKAGAVSVTNITSRDGEKNKLVFFKQIQHLKKKKYLCKMLEEIHQLLQANL